VFLFTFPKLPANTKDHTRKPIYFSVLKWPCVQTRNGAEMAVFQLCGGN